MNDSGRRSDLFRRMLRQRSSAMRTASPSSRFLASTKNLCRGHPVSSFGTLFLSQNDYVAVSYACLGRVSMNNPG